MATKYMVIILILSYALMSVTSSYGVPECSQDRYLPYLDTQYNNDHIVIAMDGESVTISCTILCPSSIENLNDCSDNIHQDWMIIDPSEDQIYQMNAVTSRNKFIRRFKIDGAAIDFSDSSRLNFEQCSVNGTDQFQFNLTLHNFTSSLEGLMVVCGIQRGHGNILADYHLIKEYARLRKITATPQTIATTPPTDTTNTSQSTSTVSSTTDSEPTTITAATDTTSSTTVSVDTTNTTPSSTLVPVVGYGSSWPDEASFPVTAALLAVCIFLILLTAALIKCNIKLQMQLREQRGETVHVQIIKAHCIHTSTPFPITMLFLSIHGRLLYYWTVVIMLICGNSLLLSITIIIIQIHLKFLLLKG